MKRGVGILAVLAVLSLPALAGRAGAAADIRGTYANGWERHPVGATASAVQLNAVYAGDSGFLALSGYSGWASRDGVHWTPAPSDLVSYALSQHIPDLNLVRVGMGGAVKGDTTSIRKEGPHGGYIAVGSYQPPGKPVTASRAEVAVSTDGNIWHHISDKSKVFLGAEMTDVARGGPGWVAVGSLWFGVSGTPIWTSTDAVHWFHVPAQSVFSRGGQITHLIHGPAGLLAISDGLSGTAQTWTSSDGVHWRAAAGDPFRGAFLMQVTAGGPGYLAAGMQDDEPAVWTSRDGLHWQRVADAAAFPGDLTALEGVASRGSTVVAVGRYEPGNTGQFGTRIANPIGSSWVWTPRSSALSPTPVPRTGTIDPKQFRLRLADLPAGFNEPAIDGWSDFCDDGSTLCNYVYNAIGPYGAYDTSFMGFSNKHVFDIESMAIEGSRANAHALASLGARLVRWWNRGGTPKQVAAPARIGQETRVYRSNPFASSTPPGGHAVAYAVEWRDGKAIGQVYVEQQPPVAAPASTVLTLAMHLARFQWQHLQVARSAQLGYLSRSATTERIMRESDASSEEG